MSLLVILHVLLLSLLTSPTLSQNDPVKCPLNFTVLSQLIPSSNRPSSDNTTECNYIRQGLRLVLSHYLQLTDSFLPPLNSSESCWDAYQTLIDPLVPNFDIRSSCGFQTSWIAQGCMNITTKAEFESHIPQQTLNDVVSNCNQSLENSSPCASCTASLSTVQASLTGPSVGNVSGCTGYPSIYAAAFVNIYGPSDRGTIKCLFSLDFTEKSKNGSKKKVVTLVVLLGCGSGFLVIVGGFWLFLKKRKRKRKRKKIESGVGKIEMGFEFGLDSMSESTTLVRVAGTMGYVAPEYALYGQLTERSDVYSFGVVLLELLSGRKALVASDEGQPSLVTDWAWSLVRKGRALDVIDNGMPELGTPEVLEKYVLVAVLCSHPQLYARPTMDQVVKMLETDLSVPSIPERPIPLVAGIDDIERSASSSGSGQYSSSTGFHCYTLENGQPSNHKEEGIKSP
ncbi:probable LRR receptor-like serine/threonine-protein kinase RKF3 [Fagus crenata]